MKNTPQSLRELAGAFDLAADTLNTALLDYLITDLRAFATHLETECKDAAQWQVIDTAPDGHVIAAHFNGKLWWVFAAKKGKGVLCQLWYSLNGQAIGKPTHWMPLPPAPAAMQAEGETK